MTDLVPLEGTEYCYVLVNGVYKDQLHNGPDITASTFEEFTLAFKALLT